MTDCIISPLNALNFIFDDKESIELNRKFNYFRYIGS